MDELLNARFERAVARIYETMVAARQEALTLEEAQPEPSGDSRRAEVTDLNSNVVQLFKAKPNTI